MNINEFVPNYKIFNNMKLNESNLHKENTIEKGKNFASALKEKLDDVNNMQINAENTTENFIKGEDTDIHKVMLDTEEAKLSLQLAVQIRNKLVESYQELNRMQL